ncbi:acyl-CoA transferase [Burkholderia sp. Bp8963]|uniref:CoA transferase n=1 Tax=Burkholderia sp. Bp8963 TaxID=2184547 RepID=UPI000F59114F|nr:CoA transferase [Burkholderia sp. Bp8963]RQS66464.1 acyl-CoA transferase [Burkholderia sp. Bp8963]
MYAEEQTPTILADGGDAVFRILSEFWHAVDGDPQYLRAIELTGSGDLVSAFRVTDLATAAISVAGVAAAELLSTRTGRVPAVRVDRRMASLWFGTSLRPDGWTLPPQWDPIAGNYRARDRWIRLHTNAPHHRDAALSVLGCRADAQSVAAAITHWDAGALETAIVEHGGCAAAMHTMDEWFAHPQGQAVASEPLLYRTVRTDVVDSGWQPDADRPLAGIRVLDLTRILAGPVATRFLAGLGADVLRIDPYGWEEPNLIPEVVLGKRCARLDLKDDAGRATLEHLLRDADVVVHGYRSDALARLGFDAETRRRLNPAIVDVSLDAYGWQGPWAGRRGFDSIVQMSAGIAEFGMRAMGTDQPVQLPVQAVDHATGYLMAAAVIRGLTERLRYGVGSVARASLARTARLLAAYPATACAPLVPDGPADLAAHVEHTSWGPAHRLVPPVQIDGAPVWWQRPASALGSSAAQWQVSSRNRSGE